MRADMWYLSERGEFFACLVEFEGQFADDLGQRLGGLAFFGELRFESIVFVLERAVLVGDSWGLLHELVTVGVRPPERRLAS